MLSDFTLFVRPIRSLLPLMLCGLFSLTGHLAYGQNPTLPTGEALEKIILEKDRVFWEAYNSCDLDKMMSLVAEEAEFYHDKGGLTQGRAALQKTMAEGLCRTGTNEIERRPVAESIRVFPLAGVGAILRGEHTFHGVSQPGDDGKAHFFHLWELRADGWKMTRIFSYDHQALPANAAVVAVQLLPEELKRFEGTFEAPQTGTVKIRATGIGLELVRGERAMPLFPKSDEVFFNRELPLEFAFTFDEETGKPVKFSVFEKGKKVEEAKWVE